MKSVCWLEIRGTINTQMLSSDTIYGCYLVFKLDRNPYGLQSANAFVTFRNDGDNERAAVLDHFERESGRDRRRGSGKAPVRIGDGLTEIGEVHLQLPDGWMEEELGSDHNGDGDGRQALLDPFRRENARPPVSSDGGRSGRRNSWGRIYRPWGRRQPRPPRPVRMQALANGSQQRENGRVAARRGDGWMEVELGSFYNNQGEDGVVDTWLLGKDGYQWKSGLIVQGIEFRPMS